MSKPLFIGIRIVTSCLGVLGVSSLIAFPAFSQSAPVNRGNTILNGTTLEPPRLTPGINNPDGTVTYPYGSRLDANGVISKPSGQATLPSVRVNHGDGSTTYHYPDGSSVTIDATKIPPTGVPLR